MSWSLINIHMTWGYMAMNTDARAGKHKRCPYCWTCTGCDSSSLLVAKARTTTPIALTQLYIRVPSLSVTGLIEWHVPLIWQCFTNATDIHIYIDVITRITIKIDAATVTPHQYLQIKSAIRRGWPLCGPCYVYTCQRCNTGQCLPWPRVLGLETLIQSIRGYPLDPRRIWS